MEDTTEPKIALTPEQEMGLLSFMGSDKTYYKYYDDVVILLETGLRISELCGLTLELDMKNKAIMVDHQLLSDTKIGYYVEVPKTTQGKREIPMTERAYQSFERIVERRKNAKAEPIIVDGYQNFLFLKQDGLPKQATHYQSMLRALVKKYNKTHEDKLPKITPHTFRHTLCTNMANKGMSTNILQYIMGYKNITMTLGYYAHGSFSSARAEMERL